MLLRSDALKDSASDIMREAESFLYDSDGGLSSNRSPGSGADRTDTEALLENIRGQLRAGELQLPDDALQSAILSALDRDFLNVQNAQTRFPQPNALFREQGWLRLTRLPISPLEEKPYALYPRWQNTIATIHALNHRLCYVLLRQSGETRIFIGAIPHQQGGGNGADCQIQLDQAIASQMPGIGLQYLDRPSMEAAFSPLKLMTCAGAVTGIPSIRKITEYGEYQTLDQIAMGLRGKAGEEQDFALIVNAMPVSDAEIVDTLRQMENLGSEIHSLTKFTKSDATNRSDTISVADTNGSSDSMGIGSGVAYILSANVSASIASFVSKTHMTGSAAGCSETLSMEYISKSAMYCEEVLDKHIARLKAGRNLGFWKTGVYVLARSQAIVQTVMGMLRAVYSGDDTYIEPIRTISLPQNSGADVLIRMLRHIPYPRRSIASVLGELYQDYATPITTEELSISTSLPRRDVPGLRLVRNATRFATNPPDVGNEPSIPLGWVLDTGAPTHQIYRQRINSLTQHTLIGGTNGSGKTYTSQTLLERVQANNIPFLVIEPSKDEYLDWAIRRNREGGSKKIRIFAPGLQEDIEGLGALKLNPFQPAGIPGAKLNMLGHLDRFKSAFINSMPMSDVLPLIMEEALYRHVEDMMDVKACCPEGNGNPLDGPFADDGTLEYPLVEGLERTAERIVAERMYDPDVTKNLSAAIHTRVRALLLGWKKALLNVRRSTDFKALFEQHDVVINLSHLTDDRDKAFIMSMLLISLWEYRESQFLFDPAYKRAAIQNQLMHLTLIEEAHRLMPKVSPDGCEGSRAQDNTSKMFSNMLSEVRAYGEGCIVVDQIPTRLIPDAIKNTNLKIIHRLASMDDIKAVSASMMLRRDQEAVIGTLQRGQAVICSEFDDSAALINVSRL